MVRGDNLHMTTDLTYDQILLGCIVGAIYLEDDVEKEGRGFEELTKLLAAEYDRGRKEAVPYVPVGALRIDLTYKFVGGDTRRMTKMLSQTELLRAVDARDAIMQTFAEMYETFRAAPTPFGTLECANPNCRKPITLTEEFDGDMLCDECTAAPKQEEAMQRKESALEFYDKYGKKNPTLECSASRRAARLSESE